ncbi:MULTISPECIES: twin-arginine translocase TatA/TatE family subunit [Desulfosporosinus]|uniref:Sec-independent protein translocase protein TatB n=2 Tax=Desulfosporosinus TaxID=79206 RepID=A0A1G8BPY6_9FIRM|nr:MULTISPECIES: twin-arginine translocase TatA/TatE family subunit [Desulfosporosinus]AFQ43218.1 Sec-independent protein secretion pathway component [Desulfosporosinus meridiei DSM 13257]SDH35287.1 sec-independent protein translocase protein TatB [Desulfosporosinus hippei DSM 8344]
MGLSEILLILVVVLILFGPEDLPVIARSLGKLVFEIRKATNELTKEFQSTIETPANVINKAFEQTTSPRVVEKDTESPSAESEDLKSEEEELLTYEDEIPKNPLAELPSDMVSYEEKGASR